MRPMKFGFGQPVRRVEDHRLTTGAGRYTDDTAVEGALHGFVLRSQYAHAKFEIRDKEAARRMKGVRLSPDRGGRRPSSATSPARA